MEDKNTLMSKDDVERNHVERADGDSRGSVTKSDDLATLRPMHSHLHDGGGKTLQAEGATTKEVFNVSGAASAHH